MISVDLDRFELQEEETPLGTLRFGFALHSGTGTSATAAVMFELPPGVSLGVHSDSAEEVVLVLDGEAEATVGEERAALGPNELAVVPAMVPHDVRNVGDRPLRALGFFPAAAVVSTFAEPPAPGAPQIFARGAAVELQASLPEASTLSA